MHACKLSCFSLVRLFATLWTVAHQASLSMGFSRQEYWSGLPCPPPGDLTDPGIEPASPVAPALWATSLPLSHWGSPYISIYMYKKKWRRQWQPTPVFLPGESQGPRSLVGCHLWGCTESGTTEVTQQHSHKGHYIVLSRVSCAIQ